VISEKIRTKRIILADQLERIGALEKKQGEADKATPIPDNWASMDYASLQLPVYQQQLAEVCDKARTQLQKLQNLGTVSPVEDLTAQLKDSQARINELAPVVSMIESGKCPTCKREYDIASMTDDPDTFVTNFKEMCNTQEALERDIKDRLEKNKHVDQERAVINTTLRGLASRKTELEVTVKTTETTLTLDPEFSREEYARRVAVNKEIDAQRSQASALRDQLNLLYTGKATAEAELGQLEKTPVLSDTERQALTDKHSLLVQHNGQMKQLTEDRNRMEGWRDASVKGIDAMKKEHEKGDKLRQLRGVLEDVRALMHRDVLPRFVMGRLVDGQNSWMNFYLRRFNKDFRLKLTPEFELLKINRDGTEVPTEDRLSGGELIAAALSFRMALGSLMVGRLPIQLLDEPTTWLDAETRTQLAEVLRNMQNNLDAGVHIHIPTHDPEIISVLTNAWSIDTGTYVERN